MNKNPLAQAVSLAVISLGFSGGLVAQQLSQEPTSDTMVIEEVVTTGTPGGASIRKLDASFSITTLNDDEIAKVSPTSTADLMKSIPGLWVESSGGVSGANIDVRGFPGGSDAPFVTVSLNGLPVYPAPTLSFLENSSLFRIDETIQRVEGLRGGPNPVYSNGQPGLTTNFILKEGTEQTEGRLKYSTSDYDLQRADALLTGKLSDDVYYMIGGYVSSSPGVRDADFSAEEGHQLTVHLTAELDNGKAGFYLRDTDDHGTWYLPGASTLPADYTQVGPSNRRVLVPVSQADGNGGSSTAWQSFDMGEGRGWDGSIGGAYLELDLGDGWTLNERFSLTSGNADTLGFVPDGSPVRLDSLTDLNGDAITSATTVSGATVSGDTLVQQFGAWVVRKDIEAVTNDLSIAKQWDTFKITAGYYTSSWEVNEWWSIGNQKYYVLGHDGEQIASVGGVGEIACNAAGVATCGWSYDVDASGDARENALYLAGEFYLGDFTFDLGVRSANRETNYSVDDGALDGVFTTYKADEDGTAYTAAVDWAFADNMGSFFRINSGFKFADFDNYREFGDSFRAGSDLVIDVDQAELGYKLQDDNYSLFATLFYNETQGMPDCVVGSDVCTRLETEATGLELDGKLYWGDFTLGLNATFQDAEITSGEFQGNQVQRQPEHQVRLTQNYDWTLSNGVEVSLYGAVSRVGERYSDSSNLTTLPAYTKVDLGTVFYINDLNVQLAVNNLTDEEGATEGDPRDPLAANVRYILPRNIKLSAAYDF
ncbi:TonB-dependent receptor [Microbulbifer thermotolerans]|uniref:TonB-dependent receptor n=1 Tax=Microbulbifer thermotolerans TaxID=252514 RepID=UPI002248828F|nr:TonB-dependent receptor [Microbulbifer thermotolerans]MCX2832622.1 TonB-dependent receptor plug domain-containing protein [Microbulbifer thermotolerans]